MTSLDLRSFNFLAALQCAVMGAVLLGIQRNMPARIRGLRAWGLAPLIGLGATFFYALQGYAPVTVVGLGGNGLLLIATVTLLAGTRQFLERPWRWGPWAGLVLLCLAGLLLFFVVWPDYRPRMLIFGLAMIIMMLVRPRGFVGSREPTAFLFERKAVSGSFTKEGHG